MKWENRRRIVVLELLCAMTMFAARIDAQSLQAGHATPARARTSVVILGSGNPVADPDRAGPAVVIVVDSSAYLFDAGAGVMRRWAAAVRMMGGNLHVTDLRKVFITHLHSDHTLGLSDVILTSWTLDDGKPRPFDIYGPAGMQQRVTHLLARYSEYIAVRTGSAGELAGAAAPIANVHEIPPGIAYRDSLVTISAFAVAHGSWKQAFGYRVQTPDKVVVVSGDTGPTDAVAQQCDGCDVLLHEGGIPDAYASDYYRRFHTTAEQLAKTATTARPKLLVLYHQRPEGPASERNYQVLRALYSGPFIVARDLDVIH